MAVCEICDKVVKSDHGLKLHHIRVHTDRNWNTTSNLTKRKQLAELEETKAEPVSENRVIVALLDRNDELQAQIQKLQEVIDGLAQENTDLKQQLEKLRQPGRVHLSEHLTERVQNALTPAQWNQLRNSAK